MKKVLRMLIEFCNPKQMYGIKDAIWSSKQGGFFNYNNLIAHVSMQLGE